MKVQVRDGIAGVVAHVEHQPVAVLEAVRLRHLVGQLEHVGEHFGVQGADTGRILDVPAGND